MSIGRPCTTCHHPERADIERAIASGVRFRAISQRFPNVSPDSLQRHCANHIANSLRADFRGEPGLSPTDLYSRMLAVADAARAARTAGGTSAREALRAGDAELRALTAIASRMGVDASALTAELEAARDDLSASEGAYEALAMAFAFVLQTVPGARQAALSALDRQSTTASATLAQDLRVIRELETA